MWPTKHHLKCCNVSYKSDGVNSFWQRGLRCCDRDYVLENLLVRDVGCEGFFANMTRAELSRFYQVARAVFWPLGKNDFAVEAIT